MTFDEIMSLKVGRALDALVVERVLGWQRRRRKTIFHYTDEEAGRPENLAYCWEWFSPSSGEAKWLPAPSTDVADALRVAESLGCDWMAGKDGTGYWFRFRSKSVAAVEYQVNSVPTLPLAVCLTALLEVVEGGA